MDSRRECCLLNQNIQDYIMQIFHKFKACPTTVDCIRFSSKKESEYYKELLMRQQKGGDVLFFLRQVPFHLPGGIKYVCDFEVFFTDGSVKFIDVKGMKLAMWVTKKKLVESLYPVEIETR